MADAGIWTGPDKPLTHRNPRGTFENNGLRRLARRGEKVTWDQVEPVLRAQGWDGQQKWLIKYKPAGWHRWRLLDPTFVIVRRNSEAIMASMMKQSHRPREMIEAKLRRYLLAMAEIPGHVVWPEKLVAGADSEFRALFAKLGLEWSGGGFVEPGLWHH